jgi:hypothetical protein
LTTKRHVIGDRNGWIRVKRENGGEEISLPEYLQVEFMQHRLGRDYFKVSEGVERGQKCSVKQGNLKSGVPDYQTAASVIFSLSKRQLTYKGGTINAVTDATNPVPVGTYPIQIPDFPHQWGNIYLHKTDYALTWFYLGYGKAVSGSNDRYLHPGRVSEGCVTVDPAAWTQLYKYLIASRSGDASNVGRLCVVA